MSLEHNLRQALHEEAGAMHAPPELKGEILNRISPGQGGRRMKKWLVAAVVAATLIIPTGAYAGYNYLADSLYGSQDNTAKIGGTQQDYDQLEAKLQQAKSSLSGEDFTALSTLLHELAGYNLQIADDEGGLHPEKLSAADQQRYKELAAAIEPYNDKLNQAEAPGTAANTADTDFAAFSNQLLVKAEQTFSGEELAVVQQLIGDWKVYTARISGPDHSSVSDDELAEQAALLEKLNPYLKKMGYRIKPSNR